MLSNVALQYIDSYYDILGEMIHEVGKAPKETISTAFISQMTPILKASCDISENILKYTTNIKIQNLANKVNTELSDMREALFDCLETCKNFRNSERDTILYIRRANAIICSIFSRAETVSVTNNLNTDFLQEMRILYSGMIEMTKNLLNFSVCSPLYNEAQHILKKLNGRF